MWNVKHQPSTSFDCIITHPPPDNHRPLPQPPTSLPRLSNPSFGGTDTSSITVSVVDSDRIHQQFTDTNKTVINSSPSSPAKPPFKMVNRLKSLVSKQKKRFQADGFDLDLSYISPRIIAMGFPAERVEGLYRNHIGEVSRFFEQKHKGHYKIYHLCNERDFDACRFSGPVVRYPFSDHNAPQFDQILALCEDVRNFLNLHPDNIVAINCKAGKGRTGVMVCACLVEMQEARNADDALQIYADQRTRDGQGVTIPSQRRYVRYYSQLVNSHLVYHRFTPLRLTSISIEGLQHQVHSITSFELSLSVYKNESLTCSYDAITTDVDNNNNNKKQPWVTSEGYLPDYLVQTGDAPLQTPPQQTNILFDQHHKESTCSGSFNAVDSLHTVDHHHHPVSTYNSLSGARTFPIQCSTLVVDGHYVIRLDEPVTVSGDVRIKIKARSGVLTKKIGMCWINTFFVVNQCNQKMSGCLDRLQNPSTSVLRHCNDYTNIPTHQERRRQGRHFSTDEGLENEDEEEALASSVSCSSGSCNSSTSSSSSASSSISQNSTPHDEEWPPSSNTPIKLSTGSHKKTPMDLFTSTSTPLVIPTSLKPTTAVTHTPSTVYHLQLRQSELDDAFKGKSKRLPSEEFKISFEFCQDTDPHKYPASSTSNLLSSSSFIPHAMDATNSGGCVAMEIRDEESRSDISSELNSPTCRIHLIA